MYSVDGITNWKDNGYAWSPRDYQKIFCYEGSTTCTQWYKMERPSVVLQDGHPTHITRAVSDVDKDNQVLPGTNHGTKVVVVPFDGVTFDQDFGVGGGGSAGTGGAGTGGASSSGGAGGQIGTAGTSIGTGGLTSTGGSNTAGGSTSTSDTGGTTTIAGAGGTVTTGGLSATGGTAATGGTPSNGIGGQLSAGGGLAVGGASASGASNADAGSNDGGCGCRVAGGAAPSKSLAIMVVLGLLRRRRSRRGNTQLKR